MAYRVEIKLCIGLHGVCVLGLVGDDQDIVDSDIDAQGVEEWYEWLPEHKKPVEGMYRLVVDVTADEDSMHYQVVDSFLVHSLDQGANQVDLRRALNKAEGVLKERNHAGVGYSKISHRVEGFIDGLKFAVGQKSDFLGSVEDQRNSYPII
jgi:hypothetical protein